MKGIRRVKEKAGAGGQRSVADDILITGKHGVIDPSLVVHSRHRGERQEIKAPPGTIVQQGQRCIATRTGRHRPLAGVRPVRPVRMEGVAGPETQNRAGGK